MRLYIPACHTCGLKISLSIEASTRSQIRYQYGNEFKIQCPHCHYTNFYTPYNITAETSSNSTAGGGVLGGLIGLLGGPLGAVIGAGLGAAIGNTNDSEDKLNVQRFKNSH